MSEKKPTDDFIVLNAMLAPLRRWYTQAGVEEIALNRPEEIWLRLRKRRKNPWVALPDKDLTRAYLEDLFHILANTFEVPFDPQAGVPVVYATLPGDHRFAGVIGKNVMYDEEDLTGGFAFNIRAHSGEVNFGFEDYGLKEGKKLHQVKKIEKEIEQDSYKRVLQLIRSGEPILISGATATGKTTFLNNLLRTINEDLRIITIEDSRELIVKQKNHVHLLLSRTTQSNEMSYKGLIDLIVRMTPDVIIGGEVSTGNAGAIWELMRSGHDHFYASIHAESPESAYEAFADRILHSGMKRDASNLVETMKKKLHVIQIARDGG
ncbi:MAG: Flp pilus assembly complex ATPase component TadA, partial [Alphaproteobacteria bacterium]|nr:Flp pilus assembly complex ATPase component TadA [Alphaproteobacteria bacterium]